MNLRITYVARDGNVCTVTPVPWFRNVSAVTKGGVRFVIDPPCAFELVAPQLFGGGAAVSFHILEQCSPEWAETEEEYAQRILEKDVPADAKDVKIVHVSALG